MSSPRTDDGTEPDEADERPEIPEGVVRGIDDLTEGRTVGKEALESLLDE